MKACEIGTEVSWLPLLCIQKGVMYEEYMHKPEVITAIEKDLLKSKGCSLLYDTSTIPSVKVVCLNCVCRAGVTMCDWIIWGCNLNQ